MDEAEAAVRSALGEQGFGVLTEIDVAANLRAALGIDRPPLKILGTCNPAFAHQALQIDPTVALLMPCNVVLEPDGSGTRIAIVDPRGLITDPEFAEIAATQPISSPPPWSRSAGRCRKLSLDGARRVHRHGMMGRCRRPDTSGPRPSRSSPS